MILESGGHLIPKPKPRQSKSIHTESTESSSIDNDEKIDRTSGDYTETKKFWQSLEIGTPIEETKTFLSTEPPVPKPRLQVAFVEEKKQSEISLKTENIIVQEISQTSSSTGSAPITISMSAQATEPSEDVQIPTDERLEDESFPMAAKSLDSDSREYGQESLELDSSHSDKSMYKLKEREDILDLDDEEEAAVKKEIQSEVGPELELTKGDDEDETNKNETSFYIGESSVNIITKSATEKRSDYAFDNDGYESTQDSAQDEMRKDISDDRFSKSSTHELEAATISDFEKTHEFLEAERIAAEEYKIEKNETEASEKEIKDGTKHLKQMQDFLEAERKVASIAIYEKSENEYSEKESHSISASAENTELSLQMQDHKPVILEAQQVDLLDSDTSITEGSPVIQSPASSTKSGKSNVYDIHSVGSEECRITEILTDQVVSFPKDDFERGRLDSFGSERSFEKPNVETVLEEADVEVVEKEIALENIKKVESKLNREIDDLVIKKIGTGVVHSPIEAKISNISFEDQNVSILDQNDELQQANEVHSPVQMTPTVAPSAQVVHFDYDEELIQSKKSSVQFSPIEITKSFLEAEQKLNETIQSEQFQDKYELESSQMEKTSVDQSSVEVTKSFLEFEQKVNAYSLQEEETQQVYEQEISVPKKTATVHSPVEVTKSFLEAEQKLNEHFQQEVDEQAYEDGWSQPKKTTLIQSSVEVTKTFVEPDQSIFTEEKLQEYDTQSSQAVHFDYDSELNPSKKTAVVHSPIEVTKPIVETDQEKFDEQFDASGAKLEVIHRKTTSKVPSTARWSVTDPDNYSSSGSHCESLENSRPCSSDVENLCPSSFANSSADYQTAQDASLLPGSTDYYTAASTLDHSGKTISSQESMKSFDSEATETLVPSTSDLDLQSDSQISKEVDLEFDEKEQQLASLETCLADELENFGTDLADLSPHMKRSHEMIFQPDPMPLDTIDISVHESSLESLERRKSDDEQKSGFTSLEESKFATSLEEGSILSMSLSSTDNVETIVENNQDDLASSFGSSMIGSYENQSLLRDDMTGTSFDDIHKGIGENIDLVMTTSLIQEDNISSANTQVTTSETPEAARRAKGHKRNDSTAFVKTIDAGKTSTESTDSTSSLDDEMVIHESADDERKESDTDSDDHYQTEYSRAFKQPTKQRKKKSFNEKNIEMPEIDLERKKSIPSIETIVEDVIAEVEVEPEKHAVSQNMINFSNIPDITITVDPYKIEQEDEEMSTSPDIKVEEEKESSKPKSDIKPAKKQEKAKPIEISDAQYQQLIDQQVKVATESTRIELKSDSPTSDSFEMLEQPDEIDDFVIVEEVAKEANELMDEGKSVSIKTTKFVKKHDDEVEKIIIKSAPAATNEGSTILQGRHDLAFEFEDSPPSGGGTGESSDEGQGNESSQKWVEMQLAEQAQNMRYPYEMERGMLEDIKEEDTDFEIGSSRISSFKDSFSSSDFDAVGKRYAAAAATLAKDHDTISMSSLQEFESLEQAISLENRKFHQGSQDSLSNGSFPKRFTGRSAQADEISLSSLKDFEGLENACLEATLLELKAKEEAQILSRSDESNKSNKSGKNEDIVPAERTVTLAKTVTTVTRTKLDEPEEDFSSSNVADASTDSIEHAKRQQITHGKEPSHHGSCDSLEISKSADVMTSSIDSIEVSKDGNIMGKSSKSDADSIEFGGSARDSKRDSIDSIDMQYALMAGQMSKVQRDSIDGSTTFVDVSSAMTNSGNQIIETTRITTTTSAASSSGYGGGISKDISNDSLNIQHSEPELLLTSTESLEHTSSTNATYQNEIDSQMTLSGSMTSCDSNTLVDVLHSDFYEPGGETTRVTTTRTKTTIHSSFHDSDKDHSEA